jgi:hypothetical protein
LYFFVSNSFLFRLLWRKARNIKDNENLKQKLNPKNKNKKEERKKEIVSLLTSDSESSFVSFMLKKYVPKSIPPVVSAAPSPLNSPYATPTNTFKRGKNKKKNLNFFHDKFSGASQTKNSKTVFSSFPEVFELEVHSPSSSAHSPSTSFFHTDLDYNNLSSLFPGNFNHMSQSRATSVFASDNYLETQTPITFDKGKKTSSSQYSSDGFLLFSIYLFITYYFFFEIHC